MKVSPICLRNKADQFYSAIEYLRIGLKLPPLANETYISKALKLIMVEYLNEKPYATLLDFLKEVSINNKQGEEE